MRGSTRLGALLVTACATGLLAACMALPPQTPSNPEIPVHDDDRTPAFTNLDDPPQTPGPETPPVPTDAPGTFALGETVTLHTEFGSTWEITVTGVRDPDDVRVQSYNNTIPGNMRAVTIELEIENVGVVTTHPYYEMMIAYQPENGPVFDQNSGPMYGDYDNDLGYFRTFSPGDFFSGHMSVYVPENAPRGRVVISGDSQATRYIWEP